MMTRASRVGTAVAILAGLVQPSFADVYLDCSSPATGNGSKGSPFNSIQSANEVVLQPGELFKIKSGTTCFGVLSPKGSGTQESPITLTSYGEGSVPIINGSGAAEAVSLINQDYWDISIGWRRGIIGTSSDGTVHRGLYIHDVTVYDMAGETNKATQSAAFIASAGIIVNGTENGSRYDDVRVYNNTIYDCGGVD